MYIIHTSSKKKKRVLGEMENNKKTVRLQTNCFLITK